MSIASAPSTAHVTGWDRAVVIALGGAGCALSYDALQQMAVAIHVRGLLTYLFPLVIDGFIAYGIRALLVLRDAPLRARLYVWTLFGTATAASIWANALHAVRLNEENTSATGLRLGDTVVAVLSTIAPLALAGAVHLYILIARGPVKASDRSDRDGLGHPGHPGQSGQSERLPVTRTDQASRQPPPPGQVTAGQLATALTDRPRPSLDKQTPDARTLAGDSAPADSGSPDSSHRDRETKAADLGGQPDTTPAVSDRQTVTEPVKGHPDNLPSATDRPVTPPPVTDGTPRATGGRRPDPDTEELLEIARSAVRAEDKLTRKVVAQAIRGQQIPLSSDTLTALMVQLRQQHGRSVTTPRN
ncbi:DUF2637 domain-containing protein [Streptomyces caniscabiei]|uniref:DUF2637 domain-containing protein n=1 Tax=Streptomyces caniscabiei TaxID=2746961 RepID=A0ABU4MYD6_9ACTN|nr:DUF2637 domain-containing protein [Streptomyces caniscabiei]MBE4741457.1 DUF2637 domain-containing protein [Streptomyces caniscabiei]MBE4761569.1 DUF2637 domain-containing protein [Streptomyces caniscabiei]MBE4790019.1 DUF2637 domain-containing protein [Streptomyces caniscabiei]MBE4799218.1 DUF2637 domain-containing protein [Streptomyces caniscabiei]MDX2947636.1 DUF2637 domain-containing protein [Streptomyces caniscabiei]